VERCVPEVRACCRHLLPLLLHVLLLPWCWRHALKPSCQLGRLMALLTPASSMAW
jgi:hypothetical protein